MRDVYPQKKRGLKIALILGLLVVVGMSFKAPLGIMIVLAITAVSLTPLVIMIAFGYVGLLGHNR